VDVFFRLRARRRVLDVHGAAWALGFCVRCV